MVKAVAWISRCLLHLRLWTGFVSASAAVRLHRLESCLGFARLRF